MALVARGRIEDANAGTFAFGGDYEYLLAREEGYEILYLLQGDPEQFAPLEAALVEITGEVAGTEPAGKYEVLAVESVSRIDDPEQS